MTTTPETPPTSPAETATPRQFAALIAAVPIVLVNALAVIGQCQWAGTHLHWGHPGQALFAGALETTALAVMYLAHTALIEGDSAWRQKAFAYLIACGSASVNWQEHSNAWKPTPAAFVFAGASLLSPILWATYSRFAARTVMRDAGLIDRRAAKFSFARWVMFPRRTFTALKYSVWHSVQSPTAAIAGSGSRDGMPSRNEARGIKARLRGSSEPRSIETHGTPEIEASSHGMSASHVTNPGGHSTPEQGNGTPTAPKSPRIPKPAPMTRVPVPQLHTDANADLAILDAAGPPAWNDMVKAEAVRRLDVLLPGRTPSQVVVLLGARDVKVDDVYVRKVRWLARNRERQAEATQDSSTENAEQERNAS
jgi:hypothetical protein